MAMNLQQASAKVYQFPKRGRFATVGDRQDTRLAAEAAALRPPKMVVGSGWYHEAAIQEAAQAAKRR